jgi:hypothetical protein
MGTLMSHNPMGLHSLTPFFNLFNRIENPVAEHVTNKTYPSCSKCWKCSLVVVRRLFRMGTDFIDTGLPHQLKHLVQTESKLDEN